jgi:hypothetical protein
MYRYGRSYWTRLLESSAVALDGVEKALQATVQTVGYCSSISNQRSANSPARGNYMYFYRLVYFRGRLSSTRL